MTGRRTFRNGNNSVTSTDTDLGGITVEGIRAMIYEYVAMINSDNTSDSE